MVEGGEFGYNDPDLDDQLDNDNDDDNDETEVNTTWPFQSSMVSTPYYHGKQMEMHTMGPEKSGLPGTSYDEAPLLGGLIHQEDTPAMLERAKDFIKRKFPKVD